MPLGALSELVQNYDLSLGRRDLPSPSTSRSSGMRELTRPRADGHSPIASGAPAETFRSHSLAGWTEGSPPISIVTSLK